MYRYSMNKIITTTTIAILAIIVATTTTATNAQASSSFKDLGRDIGNALEDLGNELDDASANYNQGFEDGEDAGVNGGSRTCPSSDGVYCVGYNTGYGKGSRAVETVNENKNKNNDDDDDGEFVDVPKRTISGGSN